MKYYKYKMQMGVLNVLAFIIMIIAIVFYYLFFHDYDISGMFIIYFILWMFLHEIIHGISFMLFKEVNAKNVTYGAKLESGIFYCMCKQPISKKVILVSLLAPFVLIGMVTLIIAIVFDLKTLGLLSLFNISGAAGDIVMTIMFLRLPKNVKYADLDDCESFVVLSDDDLSNRKYLGLKLIEYGDYNAKIVPNDFKRIRCSKISVICLLIILGIFIISLF